MRTHIHILTFTFLPLSFLIFFQNCGEGFEAQQINEIRFASSLPGEEFPNQNTPTPIPAPVVVQKPVFYCDSSDGTVPTNLSESCFSKYINAETEYKNMFEFTPRFPLHNYGVQEKKRYIYIPEDLKIDNTDKDNWIFPVGTKLWKQFAYEKDGASIPVEMRVFEKIKNDDESTEWVPRVYIWNEDGSEAVLNNEGQTIDIPDELDPTLTYAYKIPATSTCTQCHGSYKDTIAGFSYFQLDDNSYFEDDLIKGFFEKEISSTPLHLPDTPASIPALGYLSSNCSGCHSEGGLIGILNFDFRYKNNFSKDTDTNIYQSLVAKNLIDFTNREESRLLTVMTDERMPPENPIHHKNAFKAISSWVNELAAPPAVPPVENPPETPVVNPTTQPPAEEPTVVENFTSVILLKEIKKEYFTVIWSHTAGATSYNVYVDDKLISSTGIKDLERTYKQDIKDGDEAVIVKVVLVLNDEEQSDLNTSFTVDIKRLIADINHDFYKEELKKTKLIKSIPAYGSAKVEVLLPEVEGARYGYITRTSNTIFDTNVITITRPMESKYTFRPYYYIDNRFIYGEDMEITTGGPYKESYDPAAKPLRAEITGGGYKRTSISLNFLPVKGAIHKLYRNSKFVGNMNTDYGDKDNRVIPHITYTDNNLEPFTEYSYNIKTVINGVESELSDTLNAKTLFSSPLENVRCIPTSKSAIKLQWNKSSFDNATYDIYLSPDQLLKKGVNALEYIDDRVTPYESRLFKILTIVDGNTRQSTFTHCFPYDPQAPRIVTSRAYDDQFRVTWAIVHEANSYNIEIDGQYHSTVKANEVLNVFTSKPIYKPQQKVKFGVYPNIGSEARQDLKTEVDLEFK